MYIAPAVLALLPFLATATPVSKRYTNQIIRSFRTGNCLSLVPGTQIVNGSPLVNIDCNQATRWDISPGSGSVIVSGTNFALDAGVPPSDNAPAKVWTSYPGSTQQTWYLTNDNRIAITGGTQCLDEGTNGPQTYQCTTGNTNQIWYVQTPGGGPSSSASASSSASSSAPPSSSSAPPPTITGKTLRFAGNRCAFVQGAVNTIGNGAIVNMGPCVANSAVQQFTFMSNGLIQLAGTNFCLDAGVNPSNGVMMKLWQCYPGAPQQTWTFPQSTGLFATANNECLDVDNSNPAKLQTWTCSAPDPQQQFSIV